MTSLLLRIDLVLKMKNLLTGITLVCLFIVASASAILAQFNAPSPEWFKQREAATRQYLITAGKNSGVADLQNTPLSVTSLNDATSRENAIRSLFGRGVTVRSVRTTCPAFAMGTFNGTSTNIGLNQGLIISNGRVNTAPGPNTSSGASNVLNAPGDSDLESRVQQFTGRFTPTADACSFEAVVEFSSDTVIVNRFVFASEEYPEYAADLYNDGIAFFIREESGGAYENFATVPGSDTLIAVNFISGTRNNQFFIDNTNGQTIQYDGFTRPLTARRVVIPGRQYRLKIVIADFNDGAFNSGLFLENGSITVGTGLSTGSPSRLSNICAGDAITVPYSSSAQFNAGNTFTIQLSDANGSFATPVSIGSLTTTASSGTVNVIIPTDVAGGTNYRVRAVSTSPRLIGSNNGQNLSIGSRPSIDVETVVNLSCVDSANARTGRIDLTVSPLSNFRWSNGATTSFIDNLATGTYTVTITPIGGGCEVVRSYVISRPEGLTINLVSQTNVSCVNTNSGAITVSVTGATGNVNYRWSTNDQTNAVAGLTAGIYTVTATDDNGCQGIRTFQVTNPQGLVITLAAQYNVSCSGGSNASIDISVSGGTLPYAYNWTHIADVAGVAEPQDVRNLNAGEYFVTVTDASGCTASRMFIVSQPEPVTINLANQIDVRCPGQNDGSITLDVTCGSPNYTFAWSNGQTTQNIANLPAGTYTVTVTDANGCSVTRDNITITSPNSILTLNVAVVNASVPGGTGSITASASGGAGGYVFRLNDGEFSTNARFTNLPAGSYRVSVRDLNGCITTQTVSITQPAPACGIPSNLRLTDGTTVTTNTASLTWNPGQNAIGYFLQFRRKGDLLWNEIDITTTTTTRALINLNPATTYESRVRSKCASNIQSIYTNVFEFTTPNIACNKPTNLTQATSSGANTAALTWNAVSGATRYELRIRRAGTAEAYQIFSTTATNYTFTNLISGQTYETGVRAQCGTNNFSDYETGPQITVGQIVCRTPDGVTLNTITAGSATISWNPVAGAQRYEVRYKLSTATAFTVQSTSTNSATISGLTANTGYDFVVIAYCDANQASEPSPLQSFRTQSSNTPCRAVVTNSLVVNEVTSNSAVVSWTPAQGAIFYELNFRIVGSPNFSIRRPVNGTSITLQGLNPGTRYEVRVRSVCSDNRESVFTSLVQFQTSISREHTTAPFDKTYFAVYPNPNNGQFTVSFDVKDATKVGRLLVFDELGRTILNNEIVIEPGRNAIPVNLTGYSKGVYHLQFVYGETAQTAKLILE